MKTISTFIPLLIFFSVCSAQTGLDSMIAKLRRADFGDVYQVKDSIVNKGKEAIPKLIDLLKDTSFIKLRNTGDLIYPGADAFYGHGWIVNYDIDWVSVRAAWLFEEITFQDFGYLEHNINENQLMTLHQKNYSSYLQTGSHTVDFNNNTPRQKLISYRQILADSVSKWWQKNQHNWTRFKALQKALAISDERRQTLALHFLRFGETKCEGLNRDNYEKELLPLVKKIRDSKNGAAEQAQLLLDDREYYWLKSKVTKSGS